MIKFEVRIKELVENHSDLALLVEPLLRCPARCFANQIGILHRRLLAIVRDDDVCRRLMTVPGVGPVVGLTNRAPGDVPTPAQELQGGRGCVWTDAVQVSIERDRSEQPR